MGNERKLRLIQVAKEFKVGLNTITDFLQKKGIKNDGSPNTLVDAETYAVLEKEFGANRAAGNARESIRERISLKQTTITLEEAKKQEREEEKEVVIKSNVISVKDEIQQPKFLGKIDLSPKPKAAPAPAPKAEAEKPAAQHPAAPAAPAPAQAPKAAAQPAPAMPATPEARHRQPLPHRQAPPHPQRRCMRRLLLRLPRLRPLNLRNPPHRPRRHPQRRLPGNRTPSPQKPRPPRRNRPLPKTTSSVRRP